MATKYFEKASKLDHPQATFRYGLSLYNGIGVVINKKESLKYFKKAADLGDIDGMNYCAMMNEYGDGVERNYE